jgi:hypothetical protein
MAGGLWNRIKVWGKKETIQSSDLNAEFDNVRANAKPDKIDDYSATVLQMQTLFNPGGVGSENQPTSSAEELGALRYMLKAITGKTQWYAAPDTTISAINTLLASLATAATNQIVSGRKDANNQPMFLVPGNSTNAVTLKATATNLLMRMLNVDVTFSTDITLTGLSQAPSSNNTALVNDSALAAADNTKCMGEFGQVITIDNIGSEISSLNGKVAAFKLTHSAVDEYLFADIDTTNSRLIHCRRGYYFNSSDAHIPAVAITDNDVLTLMRIAWLFATYNSSTPAVDVTYNQPYVQKDTPSGPSTGDYWNDLSTNEWKRYSGSAWVTQTAIPVGTAITNSSNTIAARSADFYKPFSDLNTIIPEKYNASTVRSSRVGDRVSVYGTQHFFDRQFVKWVMAGDLETGTEAASTNYFLYVTDQGDTVLSVTYPNDRHSDLLGAYHPAKPWRCVGMIRNDASSNFTVAAPAPGGRAIKLPSAITDSSGSFSVSSLTPALITNQTIEVPTTGRPIMFLFLGVDGGSGASSLLLSQGGASAGTSSIGAMYLYRDTVFLQQQNIQTTAGSNVSMYVPQNYFIDYNPGIGGRKYEFKASGDTNDPMQAANLRILSMELAI